MRFDVITLFADAFKAITEHGITRRAHEQQLWQLNCWSPREYAQDKWRTVDDRAYGGGPGMVMMINPLAAAVQAGQASRIQAGARPAKVALLSPQGRRIDQTLVTELIEREPGGLILVCGRYEGIDERFITQYVDEQYSLGDFVLSGGEIAAMALMDALVRQLPGVLNDEQSAAQDSYSTHLDGLLDCPHYTRPEQHALGDVPSVLMSGHHENIARWRRQQSLARTAHVRPELIVNARAKGLLTKQDEAFLAQLESQPKV